ncbi:MAG TPA: bilirubin oxidase [Flavobacterium sp.]|nr:bilirubin oxidase [Flavobacterium sp.]
MNFKQLKFKKMKNIISLAHIVVASILILSIWWCGKHDMDGMNPMPVPVTEGNFNTPLVFPSISGANTILTAQNITANVGSLGSVTGYGYTANNLLGPTIKVNDGTSVNFKLVNQINEKTNIHWHGLKIPADMDGHPESVIGSGVSFDYNFTISQRAAMYWYHPHPHEQTGMQVFKGLAGLLVVNDAEEATLNLPSDDRELPLVIQDKRISGGSIPYAPIILEQMAGYMGHYILVNGIYAPFHNVKTAKYRVRVLNGSNARIYNLALSNNAIFTIIGNDGGLLANPQKVNSLLLGPGERADLIVDFSQSAINSEIYLISKTFEHGGTAQGTQEFKIMKFIVTSHVTDNFTVPNTLSSISVLTESLATKSRNFDIQNDHSGGHGGHGGHGSGMMEHTINGKAFDMNRIDEIVQNGAIEIWTFDNTKGDEPHPMHLHGVQFQILNRTGGRGALTPLESGWKDTVLVMAGEKVKIIIPFNAHKGIFLFHCHNLEHEDTGMMGQFKVE